MKKQIILILLLVGICSSNYAYNYVSGGSETVVYEVPAYTAATVSYEVFGGPTDWYKYSEQERWNMTTMNYRSSITFYADDSFITRFTSYDWIWEENTNNFGGAGPSPWTFKVVADAESGASVSWATSW